MLVDKKNITRYIPHRAPIVLIDSIEQCDQLTVSTRFRIEEGNMFLSDGYFSESGLLENIAQTAAAKIGYECELKGIDVPLGFIGSINKVNIHDRPSCGSTISTLVEIKNEVFGVTIIQGQNMLDDQILASCEMKVITATPS